MNKHKNFNGFPYLAIEERPNSFMPVALNSLDILNEIKIDGANIDKLTNNCTLPQLDFLTSLFTKQEIIEAIIRSNTISVEINEDIPLIVMYDHHKLPILTKDDKAKLLDINTILDLVISNPQVANIYKNKFDVLFRKYEYHHFSDEAVEEMLMVFHSDLEQKDKFKLNKQFEWIQYTFKRELLIYMSEMLSKEKKQTKPKRLVKEGD